MILNKKYFRDFHLRRSENYYITIVIIFRRVIYVCTYSINRTCD